MGACVSNKNNNDNTKLMNLLEDYVKTEDKEYINKAYKYLLKPYCCNLDIVNNNDETALMLALKTTNYNIISEILKNLKLCNVNYTNKKNESALTYLISSFAEKYWLRKRFYMYGNILIKFIIDNNLEYDFSPALHMTIGYKYDTLALKLLETPNRCNFEYIDANGLSIKKNINENGNEKIKAVTKDFI